MKPFHPGHYAIHGPSSDAPVIETVQDWRIHAPPKNECDWRPGYSAHETASSWILASETPSRLPTAIESVFSSSSDLDSFVATCAVPEWKTPLDLGPSGQVDRGPRNHDVLLFGHTKLARVVVGLEAKTDEPFDRLIGLRLAQAERTLSAKKGRGTDFIERVQRLSRGVFGRPVVSVAGDVLEEDAGLAWLPFQFLSGIAGTLREASRQEAGLGVFLVHHFTAPGMWVDSAVQNRLRFDLFCKELGCGAVDGDGLIGPISVPGGQWVPAVPLFVDGFKREANRV